MSSFKPIQEQIEASAPHNNVWVTANAGSGKTSVLTSRFIRLMLQGVEPEKILCITYTNAGAGEMKEKIFKTFSKLALMPESERKAELSNILGSTATEKQVEKLQQVYLKIIDRPDKIKIQTIHSLCQFILKKFSIEAGVQPYFQIIDEISQKELINESYSRLFSLKLNSDNYIDEIQHAIKYLSQNFSETTIHNGLRQIIGKRYKYLNIISQYASLKDYSKELHRLLEADFEEVDLFANVYSFITPQLPVLISKFQEGPKKTNDYALLLADYAHNKDYQLLKKVFFNSDGVTLSSFNTLAIVKNDRSLAAQIKDFQAYLQKIDNRLISKKLCKTTESLAYLIYGIIEIYDDLKQQRSALDYDDLIHKTIGLLTDTDAAQWVLFKLDGGIDHLMLDEAQDTSPEQWHIVNALTSEFFSGENAKKQRTIFVVGDEKQSIYRFQGADINNFYKQKKFYQQQSSHMENSLKLVPFITSFRTLPAILSVVDKIFEPEHLKSQITDVPEAITHNFHRGNRTAHFGYFEIKPSVKVEKEKLGEFHWHLPRQYPESAESTARKKLAANIAADINTLITKGALPAENNRPIVPGDIMILVKSRDELFTALPKELLKYGIKTTGGDRQVLTDHIAVEDLLSFAKFLVLPEDDYNFACLLKSPIFNMSEDDLFQLAYAREGKTLFERMLENKGKYAEATDLLLHFLSIVDYTSPPEIFAELLEVKSIRGNFYKRLGVECKTVIDEFLYLCQQFESSHNSGMQGFITWLDRSGAEVKTALNNSPDEVRLLTVHGSKGLEAPIVILADAKKSPDKAKVDTLFFLESIFICPLVKDIRNDLANSCIEALRQNEENEYNRLLYVALTRARDELYVYGAETARSGNDNWYQTIYNSVSKMDVIKNDESLIISHPDYISARTRNTPDPAIKTIENANLSAYHYLNTKPEVTKRVEVFSPSSLTNIDEEKQRLYESQKNNEKSPELERGKLIHKLLENLPKIERNLWHKYSTNLFANSDFPELPFNEIFNEAESILSNKEFDNIFCENSLTEVPVIGEVDGVMLSGKIDRLCFNDEEIIIVDYKTNRKIAESDSRTHKKYQTQLMAYKKLIEKIYPEKNIKTAILWSRDSKIEYLSA